MLNINMFFQVSLKKNSALDLKRKINTTSEVVFKGAERQGHVRSGEIPEEKG